MEYIFYHGSEQIQITSTIGVSSSLGISQPFSQDGNIVMRKVVDTNELVQSELDAIHQILIDNSIDDPNWKDTTKIIVG